MSYILDALKKAENERAIGRVPGLGSGQELPPRNAAGRWLWILLAVLLVNALLLVILLWPTAEPTPTPDAAREQPAIASSTPPATRPAVAPPSVPLSPPPAPLPEASRPAAPAPPPKVLRPLPALPEPADAGGVEAVTGAESGIRGKVSVAPPAVSAAAARSHDNLPVWPQISAQLLSEINGSLHLDVHVYSDQPDERFVMINMRKYHIGDTLQEGPRVDAITPGGVILAFHGQRFRMLSR